MKKTEAIFFQQMFSTVIPNSIVVFIPNVCVHNVRIFVSRTTYAVNRERKLCNNMDRREQRQRAHLWTRRKLFLIQNHHIVSHVQNV